MKKDNTKVKEEKKNKKEKILETKKSNKARDNKDYEAMLLELVRDEVKKL